MQTHADASGGAASPRTAARHSVLGARPKSISGPGTRATSAPSSFGSPGPTTVEEYKVRLVELYRTHNPGNVAKVDYLLGKYKGQEDFLYRSVCAKYQRSGDAGATKITGSEGVESAGHAATRPKAELPRPPIKDAASFASPDGALAAGQPANLAGAPQETKLAEVAALAHSDAAAEASLLAKIDFMLLGGNSGFFDKPIYPMEPSVSGKGSSSESVSPSGESSSSEEDGGRGEAKSPSGSLDAAGVPADDAIHGASAIKPSLPRLRPEEAPGDLGLKALPADRRRSSKTTDSDPREASPPAADDRNAAAPVNGNGAGDEDSDFSDERLAAALGAKLQEEEEASDDDDEDEEDDDDDDDEAGAEGEEQASQSPQEGEAAPAPDASQEENIGGASLVAQDEVGDGSETARHQKSTDDMGEDNEEAAAADVNPLARPPATKPKAAPLSREIPPPPLFDQWLACLKFLVGWNDQKTYSEDEVKEAFREHLREEGIDSSHAINQLCETVVPLLLDLRTVDAVVVKNVQGQVIRGLKTVQVGILRIVAFELCRDRDAKGNETTPYLAKDISCLAKVVQHFRFDRAYSGGLQQLITSIRKQKREARKAAQVANPAPPKKRKTMTVDDSGEANQQSTEGLAAA